MKYAYADGSSDDTYETVDHPKHYNGGVYEHHRVVLAWDLNYYLGNATKYICRAGRKPGVNVVEDLKKSLWYIQAEIDRLERQQK